MQYLNHKFVVKVATLHHADGPAPGPPAPDDRSLATRCLRAVPLARRSNAGLEPVTPADSDTVESCRHSQKWPGINIKDLQPCKST